MALRKFRPEPSPLDKDLKEKEILPQHAYSRERFRIFLSDKIRNAGTNEARMAWQLIEAEDEAKARNSAVTKEFGRDFRLWLTGQGRPEDVARTHFGRMDLQLLPGVADYLVARMQKEAEFELRLGQIQRFAPMNLLEAFWYFKFIVRRTDRGPDDVDDYIMENDHAMQALSIHPDRGRADPFEPRVEEPVYTFGSPIVTPTQFTWALAADHDIGELVAGGLMTWDDRTRFIRARLEAYDDGGDEGFGGVGGGDGGGGGGGGGGGRGGAGIIGGALGVAGGIVGAGAAVVGAGANLAAAAGGAAIPLVGPALRGVGRAAAAVGRGAYAAGGAAAGAAGAVLRRPGASPPTEPPGPGIDPAAPPPEGAAPPPGDDDEGPPPGGGGGAVAAMRARTPEELEAERTRTENALQELQQIARALDERQTRQAQQNMEAMTARLDEIRRQLGPEHAARLGQQIEAVQTALAARTTEMNRVNLNIDELTRTSAQLTGALPQMQTQLAEALIELRGLRAQTEAQAVRAEAGQAVLRHDLQAVQAANALVPAIEARVTETLANLARSHTELQEQVARGIGVTHGRINDLLVVNARDQTQLREQIQALRQLNAPPAVVAAAQQRATLMERGSNVVGAILRAGAAGAVTNVMLQGGMTLGGMALAAAAAPAAIPVAATAAAAAAGAMALQPAAAPAPAVVPAVVQRVQAAMADTNGPIPEFTAAEMADPGWLTAALGAAATFMEEAGRLTLRLVTPANPRQVVQQVVGGAAAATGVLAARQMRV